MSEMYSEEFEELERAWGVDVGAWRDQPSRAGSGLAEGPETRRSA